MAGINVSALNDFNNELAGKIVMDSIFEGTTRMYAEVQEGIKYQEPLNLVSVNPHFQGGDAVSTLSGSLDFTQRNITVTKRTAYDGWNLQLVTEKYLGKSVLDAGSYEDTMNILSNLGEDLVKKAQQQNDYFIWRAEQGAVTSGTDSANAAADGLLNIISGSTPGVSVPTGTGANAIVASTAYTQLYDMYESLDANVDSQEDISFFCGPQVFKRIINGFTTQNLFHFDPTADVKRSGNFYEVGFPGSPNVKIVSTWGLNGSERVVLGPAKDIVIGTDLESDTANFQMWYDINADMIKYRMRNKLGAQIAHPAYWVSNDQA